MKIFQEDIVKLRVDAIVNAANTSLLGGGGVDGAIHDAAGPSLLKACIKLGGCETGDVKVTSGYDLPVKFIFHAVGPVWNSGKKGEAEKLRACYRRSMEIASELRVRSIAFPAISCGAFRYPPDQAAEISISTVSSMIKIASVNVV
jgi:O-acetyl-ADP-ribose deacetylase (regulator of RNase III)